MYQNNNYYSDSEAEIDDSWKWVTGEPLDFTNWLPGEPNNLPGEDFAMMITGDIQGWNDAHVGGEVNSEGILQGSKSLFILEINDLPEDNYSMSFFDQSYLNLGQNDIFNLQDLDQYSIQIEIYPNDIYSNQRILAYGATNELGSYQICLIEGKLRFHLSDRQYLSDLNLIQNGQWQRITVVKDYSNYKVYNNSTEILTFIDDGIDQSDSNLLFLGREPTADSYYNGLINNVKLFSSVISIEELNQNCFQSSDLIFSLEFNNSLYNNFISYNTLLDTNIPDLISKNCVFGCTNNTSYNYDIDAHFADESCLVYENSNIAPIDNFDFIAFFDSSYYFYSHDFYSWDDAYQLSDSLGGHLITISSQQESDFISSYLINSNSFNESYQYGLWIGLYNDLDSGWSWVTQENFDFSNWNLGEPNSNAYWAKIYTESTGAPTGTWDDTSSGELFQFILEVDAVFGCIDDSLASNYDSNANTSSECLYDLACGYPQYVEFIPNWPNYSNEECNTPIVLGCTDSLMFNYDEFANTDDGSCYPIISGCIDTEAYNYDSLVNTPDNSLCIPFVYGCTDSLAFNYDVLANSDNGECITVLNGCTDSLMFNYDQFANTDDNSCIPVIVGCMSSWADNYDINANTQNESLCEKGGCINITATNYDSLATYDNGQCQILGCTLPLFPNFNPLANIDPDFDQCDMTSTDIWGCTNPDDCSGHYDPNANMDNGSCELPQFGYNCLGEELSQSISFIGDNSYIDVGVLNNFPTDNITISFWLKNQSIDNSETIISISSLTNDNHLLIIIENNELKIISDIIPYPSNEAINTNFSALYNDWTYLTLVINSDSGEFKFFQNSIKIYEAIIPELNSFSTSPYIVFGADQDTYGGDLGQHLNGSISSVEIWDRTISQYEIYNFMNCPPSGNEVGLIGFWNFNEGQGEVTYDLTENANNGIIYNIERSSDTPIMLCQQSNTPYQVGDIVEGGVVFVDDSQERGLVADMSDLPGYYEWGCHGDNLDGAYNSGIGYGLENTFAIDSLCDDSLIAASVSLAFESNGYEDWYLPSIAELELLYNNLLNQLEIDSQNDNNNYYWSSTQINENNAFDILIENGSYDLFSNKYNAFKVRPIRAFGNWIMGCMDSIACNFNPDANMADGSCNYPKLGYDCDDNLVEFIVGMEAEGGIIFYVDSSGGGLVAFVEDLGKYEWGCHGDNLDGAYNSGIGYGLENTFAIDSLCDDSLIAASVSLAFESNGYEDWYLPSIEELELLYNTLGNSEGEIANLTDSIYWSSSQANLDDGWVVNFATGSTEGNDKSDLDRVRVIRSFEASFGCVDETACNYVPEANISDGNCGYAEEGFDCDGVELAYLGQQAYGGLVFYVDSLGVNGLVASTEDLSDNYKWGCYGTSIPGAEGQAIGTGHQNSISIFESCSETTAASATLALELDGYSDWYLPSIDELVEMYTSIGQGGPNGNIGAFENNFYWSSSGQDDYTCWGGTFADSIVTVSVSRNGSNKVRPIRSFSIYENYGCTDSSSYNYDPYAEEDNGSCLPFIFGCIDQLACNYDTMSNSTDNSCIYPQGCESCSSHEDGTGFVIQNDLDNDGICDINEIQGCQDNQAFNYNSDATDDDGSCQYTEFFTDSLNLIIDSLEGQISISISNIEIINEISDALNDSISSLSLDLDLTEENLSIASDSILSSFLRFRHSRRKFVKC